MNCFNTRIKHPPQYHFNYNNNNKILENEQNFQSNFVKTSKYNLFTFIPVSLTLQFKRLPNVYFLIIAILQTIPQISTLTPVTAWAPLIVVIALSMVRQGIQDYNRYKSDKQMNAEKTMVRRNGNYEQINWSDLVVGEICRVEKDQTFPADLLLLRSSIEGGTAYIQTASLDGEKNLKPRLAKKETTEWCQDDKISNLNGKCLASLPEKDLDMFQCKLFLDQKTSINVSDDKQFLYRGAKLKNTEYILGLVIYTGKATKIMLNSGTGVQKMSQIELKVNILLIFIFLFQCVLAFICSVAYGLTENQMKSSWYIEQDSSVGGQSVLNFFSYLVLFNTMIPISLIVSLEIVKFVQGIFIESDKLLFNKSRGCGVKVFSSPLNQQLGQIQYIFTDKTGTLTCNKMDFKLAIVGQRIFGDMTLYDRQQRKQEKYQVIDQKLIGFNDKHLLNLLEGKEMYPFENSHRYATFTDYRTLAYEYLFALSTAHECVAQEKNGLKFYQGPSPDEVTLVNAAKNMGFQFIKSDNQYIYISINKQVKRYQLLYVFPFSSLRKRMSIILRDNGVIKMYTKGADSIIQARLGSKIFENTLLDYLDYFSKYGLRTLLIGTKVISNKQFQHFHQKFQKLEDQAQKDIQIDKIQKGFQLLGATIVEDRLQQNVPQTLRDMIRANIKVWMLTGDKLETAKNIAASCNLIQKSFKIIEFEKPKQNNIELYIQFLKKKVTEAQSYNFETKKALVIQGPIQWCFWTMTRLAEICQAVVCCRLAPQQKADLVFLVRTYLNKITLSIGDGSNDVPMIKTAHIGIGLYGEQGMGAVQASDYALPEFQGLWRLLFVHGRWNYIRIADMILYFFYKNMLFTIPQFYYAFYCAFSGQTFFDDTYISLFNIIFTSIPLIVRALLEQDVYYIYKSNGQSKRKSMKLPEDYEEKSILKKLFPKIYYIGQQNNIFNYKRFFFWVLEAILQGILISQMCIYVLGSIALNGTGINTDLWVVSISCFSCVIVLVTFKLSTHTKFWSWLMALSLFFLSICLYLAYMWISNVYSTNVQGSIIPIFASIQTYLTVFFCTGILLIIDGLIVYLNYLYDFKTGKISKIQKIIDDQKIQDKPYFQQIQLHVSQVPTIKH